MGEGGGGQGHRTLDLHARREGGKKKKKKRKKEDRQEKSKWTGTQEMESMKRLACAVEIYGSGKLK